MRYITNIREVKKKNLSVLFSHIYHSRPISRAKLAEEVHLSPPAVSTLIDEMLGIGIIKEVGTVNILTSGRRPMMLDINPDGGYTVTIELLKTGFVLSLNDLLCKSIYSENVKVSDINYLGDNISNTISSVISSCGISDKRLIGIIIGTPGIIDHSSKRIVTSATIEIGPDNCFFDIVRDRFKDIPVILFNKSSFCAYAEKWSEGNSVIHNMVYIIVGENAGVGAGLLVDGELYNGIGNAGEIGHMSIDFNGPSCFCGNRGCFEKYVNIPAILGRFIYSIISGRNTNIMKYAGGDLNRIDINLISKCLQEGDPLTLEIMDDISDKFARGLNNIINVFNPEEIRIGGVYPKLGDIMLNKIQAHVSSIWNKSGNARTKIRYRQRECDDVAFGGAMYFIDKVFSVDEFKKRI